MVALAGRANPIEWLESRYQHRSTPAFARRWWPLLPLGAGWAVAVIALTLQDVRASTREYAILLIWIVHALAASRAIVAGANAVSREHVSQTWDTLVLTGVSVRRILMGKWLAVLRQIAPWMLVLGAVRLALLPVFMLAFVNRFAWRTAYGSSGYMSYGYSGTSYLDWVAWAAFVAVAATVLLTLLEMMACSALGLAASAVLRRGWPAMAAAFIVRFLPVILFAGFTRYEVGAAPSWRVLRFPPLSLADGGSASLYQLVLPETNWTFGTHSNALPGLLMVAVMLSAMLLVG
ncbi:MAG: ABC transporter permease subunit, partial [Anaerolineae bacterium]|nr:ABC transporter permease subunit [Anaerolineae bacterium]